MYNKLANTSGMYSPMTRSGLKIAQKALNANNGGTTRLRTGGGVTSPVTLSNFFRTVDRNFYFQQEMKLKDSVKPAGHYKPTFDLVDPRVQNPVKYDVEEFKDEII